MREIKLPPRLCEIAGFVTPGTRVADIGTDHGLIPVFLALQGSVNGIIASDVKPKPLSAAMALAERYGVSEKIRFVLCDGLEGLEPTDADTIIIAGMGGENIAGILQRAPQVLDMQPALILQPQKNPEHIRSVLEELNYNIMSESLVSDNGHIYPVFRAEYGRGELLSDSELIVGKWELICGHPLFRVYLDWQIMKTQKELNGLKQAEILDDFGICELRRLLFELNEMLERGK